MIVAGSIEYERIQGKLSSIEPIMFQEAEYLAKQVFLSFIFSFLFVYFSAKFEIWNILGCDIIFIQAKQSYVFNSNFEFLGKADSAIYSKFSIFFLVF